jgi:uncharacterized membrane protein YeaQ/YmgE (transglycosylase-associated protein family)
VLRKVTGKGMSILAWMALGLIAGFVASKLVNKTGEGVLMDIALGIVGALAGGWLFNQFGQPGVTGLDLWSLIVAVVGAVVVLVAYHAITGRVPRQV